MLVQLNTDGNIEGREKLAEEVEAQLLDSLGRFVDRLTRIEVHLGDVNAGKAGADDKRCQLEARPAGRQPLSVSHQAPSVEMAVDGAIDKLRATLDRTFGKLDDHKGLTSFGGDQTI